MTDIITQKAVITQVQIGSLSIDGLMLPNGDYAIAVPQVAELFMLFIGNASRDLKALLGKDVGFISVKSPLNSNKVNAINLVDFKRIILSLAYEGNEKAILFWNKAFPDLKMSVAQKYTAKSKQGYIYLFEGVNILKLGYSTDVQVRLKSLSRWDGELELVATKKGNINKEKSLHRTLHLTGDCFGDEWYPSYRKNEILRLMDIISSDDEQSDLSCNAILEKTLETF